VNRASICPGVTTPASGRVDKATPAQQGIDPRHPAPEGGVKGIRLLRAAGRQDVGFQPGGDVGIEGITGLLERLNRDELQDRGAEIWHQTVKAVKDRSPQTTIETLIPDVKANWDALERMISPGQEVVSHNMETVERLYRKVRPQAKYVRSLEQIQRTKAYGKRTKSGIMVGLGETKEDVLRIMDDLAAHGCDILTIGQYLQPTKMHIEVAEFIHPDLFAEYREIGLAKGLLYVESGPLVRSSYHAEKHVF
jgi:lipoic acid synthetase